MGRAFQQRSMVLQAQNSRLRADFRQARKRPVSSHAAPGIAAQAPVFLSRHPRRVFLMVLAKPGRKLANEINAVQLQTTIEWNRYVLKFDYKSNGYNDLLK